MRYKNKQQGFTLIELLVVVAILAVLSSLLFLTLKQTRIKSRDSRRKADLVSLQKALELYYGSNSGYPCTGTCGGTIGTQVVFWSAAGPGTCSGSSAKTFTGATGYIPDLAPTFVDRLPADPFPTSTNCTGYNYISNGKEYKIISNTVGGVGGPESFPSAGQPFYDPARPGTAWMVSSNDSVTATW
jgi:prepilin-type N-terminal cleavage/methylation domain-containing protein